MKKGFLINAIALMACLLCSFGAMAQEAYSVFTEADSTLTFFYDDQRSTRTGTSYSLTFTDSVPGWHENRENVFKVVFDTTFVAARPTSTRAWFQDLYHLDSITGIEYLKTKGIRL